MNTKRHILFCMLAALVLLTAGSVASAAEPPAVTSEYARRAHLTKEAFTRHGFRIVYDHDLGEPVSDGFFYTIGYGSMSSAELLSELLLYGVCAISLTSTGSQQPGIRVCISQMNRPDQFEELDRRLALFERDHR